MSEGGREGGRGRGRGGREGEESSMAERGQEKKPAHQSGKRHNRVYQKCPENHKISWKSECREQPNLLI